MPNVVTFGNILSNSEIIEGAKFFELYIISFSGIVSFPVKNSSKEDFRPDNKGTKSLIEIAASIFPEYESTRSILFFEK